MRSSFPEFLSHKKGMNMIIFKDNPIDARNQDTEMERMSSQGRG